MTHRALFLLVLTSVIIVPFSNDVFISGLPAMGRFFHVDDTGLIISLFLLGLAVSQPFYGPLSDRFGRKPVFLIGLLIYVISSMLILLAQSWPLLVTARFVQAIGACSVVGSILAILRDTYSQEKMVSAMALVFGIIGVCPVIAPLIGSIVNSAFGWRASFVILFVLGAFYMVTIGLFFKETQEEKNLNALKPKHILMNYLSLIRNLPYLKFCLSSGFSYGVLFSYLAISPFFIIIELHCSLIAYGIIIALNGTGIIVMAFLAPKISRELGLKKTLYIGLILITSGGLLMVIINTILTLTLLTFILPMFISIVGIGMIRPTASAGAMSLAEKKISGSAAAGFNFISFAGGAATTGFIHTITHVQMYGAFILMMGAVALLINFPKTWLISRTT